MATFQTYQSVGIREDLTDEVFMISPEDTPFTSAIGKTTATQTYHEWQTDALRAPSATNAAVEGFDATYGTQTATTRLGAHTQIVSDTFKVSETLDAVKKAGPTEIARLKAKKAIELKKDIEASCLVSTTDTAGNATTGRSFKGLAGWITTNVDANGGTGRAFAEASLKNALLLAYQSGGNVTQVHMSPAHKQVASTFTGNVARQQVVQGDASKQVLTAAYAIYGSDFGNVELIPNRVMAAVSDTNVYCVDTSNWKLATLRPFNSVELAQIGDARNFMVTWEGTLEAGNQASSAKITDLT